MLTVKRSFASRKRIIAAKLTLLPSTVGSFRDAVVLGIIESFGVDAQGSEQTCIDRYVRFHWLRRWWNRRLEAISNSTCIQAPPSGASNAGFLLTQLVYRCAFNLYCGRHPTAQLSEHGLSHTTLWWNFSGHSTFKALIVDNFYTCPALLHALKEREVGTSWTLHTNREGIPASVVQCRRHWIALMSPKRPGITYAQMMMCMHVGVTTNVCVLSNSYPGHSDGTIKRRGRNHESGEFASLDLPLPSAVKQYMSDQLINYHQILRVN